MGTFELINAIVSLIGGGIMTLWAQSRADLAEERKWRAAGQELTEQSTQGARGHEAKWKGFYWVRSALALFAGTWLFLAPMLLLFVDGAQTVVGYYDFVEGGWLPWQHGQEAIHWVKAGAAEPSRTFVFDPIKNNIALMVFAMYFGNQFARRA